MENGRVFIIGRYVDIMFAQDSSQHATDIEARLLGNTPSFEINGFALRMPVAKGSVAAGMPSTILPAIRSGSKGSTACSKPRGSMERATFWPRLKLSRKAMESRGEGAVERGPCIKALGGDGAVRGHGVGTQPQDRCAVLMVRCQHRHTHRRFRPLRALRACICGPVQDGCRPNLKQDEIFESLAMLKVVCT